MGVCRAVGGVLEAIGDTPLVALTRLLEDSRIDVWAKLEAANPGGSSKDRPAAGMVLDALRDGSMRRGTTVIESTSGNMGVGLAQACRCHDLGLVCVVDARAHDRDVRMLRALGADVRVVSRADCVSGDLLTARLALVAGLVATIPGAFWPNQYADAANPAVYAAGTMREIDEALDGDVGVVLVATSTTGTLHGCGDYVREHGRATQLVAVDVVGSALFGGVRAPRALSGFGAGVEAELSCSALFDRFVRVLDIDCVVGCRRLVAGEAILAGGSLGAVASALESVASGLPAGSRCVLVLPGGGAGCVHVVYDDGWVAATLGHTPSQLAALVALVALVAGGACGLAPVAV